MVGLSLKYFASHFFYSRTSRLGKDVISPSELVAADV
jgi:hypothetical protein